MASFSFQLDGEGTGKPFRIALDNGKARLGMLPGGPAISIAPAEMVEVAAVFLTMARLSGLRDTNAKLREALGTVDMVAREVFGAKYEEMMGGASATLANEAPAAEPPKGSGTP